MEKNKTTFAVVLTGGECDTEKLLRRRRIPDGALTIAADVGYRKAAPLGLNPQILVGDFDSLSAEEIPNADVEIVRVPQEKDFTDTMLACNIAIERGCDELLIVGGFGGRCDHEFSNAFWLENLRERGARAVMTDGAGFVRVIRDETVELARHDGYFSVFALDVCTATLEGCKYPLERATLKRSFPYAVSNEFAAETARITVEGVALLCDVYSD